MSKTQRRIEELQQCIARVAPHLTNQMQQHINQQELLSILNQLCKESRVDFYDQEIYEELVEKIQQEGSYLTPYNFLKVYTEAEDILNLKIEHMDITTNKYQQNCTYLDNLIRELNTRFYQPKKNMNQNDYLVIDNVQVTNLQIPGGNKCEPYLVLKLAGKSQASQVVYSSNPHFVFQDKNLTFQNYLDALYIEVYDRQKLNGQQNYMYGYAELPVHGLPFFENKSVKYNLVQDGVLINSSIELACHIEVFNTDRATQDLRQQYQLLKEKIQHQSQEKEEVQLQIEQLQQPFKKDIHFKQKGHYIAGLYDNNRPSQNQQQQHSQINRMDIQNQQFLQSNQGSNINGNNNNKSYQQDDTVNNRSHISEQQFRPMSENQQPQFVPPQIQEEGGVFMHNPTPIYEQQQQFSAGNNPQQNLEQHQGYQRQYDPGEEDETDFDILTILKRSDILTYIWIVLAILSCLKRPMFIDILIGCGFIIQLYKKMFTPQNYKDLLMYYLIGVSVTISIDILWMFIYVGGWHSDKGSVDKGAESFLRGVVILLSFITLFFKLAILGSYFILRNTEYSYGLKDLQIKFMDNIRNTVRYDQDSAHAKISQQQLDNPQQDYNNDINGNNNIQYDHNNVNKQSFQQQDINSNQNFQNAGYNQLEY